MGDAADVLVVGAGHNGLAAAALLAREGLDVRVLELSDRLGGAVATAELVPGYRFSTCAYALHLLHERVAEEVGLELDLLEPREATVLLADGTVARPEESGARALGEVDGWRVGTVADAFARAAAAVGARIEASTEVRRLRRGGVELADGRRVEARAVLDNAAPAEPRPAGPAASKVHCALRGEPDLHVLGVEAARSSRRGRGFRSARSTTVRTSPTRCSTAAAAHGRASTASTAVARRPIPAARSPRFPAGTRPRRYSKTSTNPARRARHRIDAGRNGERG